MKPLIKIRIDLDEIIYWLQYIIPTIVFSLALVFRDQNAWQNAILYLVFVIFLDIHTIKERTSY